MLLCVEFSLHFLKFYFFILFFFFTLKESFNDLRDRNKVQSFSILNSVDQLPQSSTIPLLSCNAYTGAFSIARALNEGVQIIVTGNKKRSYLLLTN